MLLVCFLYGGLKDSGSNDCNTFTEQQDCMQEWWNELIVSEFTEENIRYEKFLYSSMWSRMNSVMDSVQGIWHYL